MKQVFIKDGKTSEVKKIEVNEEELDNYTTILELLLKIREEREPSLVLRYSCRMALCGSCGMIINGRPRLACLTKVKDLGDKIMIEPLRNLPSIRGLVPDLKPFFLPSIDQLLHSWWLMMNRNLQPLRTPRLTSR